MAMYLLENNAAKTIKTTKRLIVQAVSAAHAKIFAAAYFDGDGSWADATATTLTAGTLDDAGTMTGYVWKITIRGAAAQTSPNETLTAQVTGAASADLDAVAAQLVTALNALNLIANAAYSAPNLTLSSIADGLGDATVTVEVYKDSVSKANIAALYTGTITHEGIAAAALVVALVADTVATPAVLAEA
jgi:hypothetical protein